MRSAKRFSASVAALLLLVAAVPATKEEAAARLAQAEAAVAAAPEGPSRSAAEAVLEAGAEALAAGNLEEVARICADAERLVSAPSARVTVVVDAAGGSRFLVNAGAIEVTSGRTTAVATAGQMATAATAGTAPVVERIPVGVPRLLEPAEGLAIDWDDLLRWSRPDGAQRFQVWISRDALFRDRVSMLKAEGASITVDPDLDTGTYWWRVASVAKDGTESLPSEARSFRLAPDPDGRLYWVRYVSRACAQPPCPKWLAVDTVSGAERAVADVDLGLLGLDRQAQDKTREQLLKGEMAVVGSIKPGGSPDRSVLVVSSVRGVQ